MSEEILAHYRRDREAQRLFSGPGVLERVRTEEIVSRHLPPPPARIIDIGGGPGVYAEWLARQGYAVDLVDIVPLHIEQARSRLAGFGERVTARTGDARRLEAEDESFDAALMLGPMYHLTEHAERVAALAEMRRVLRPGAFAFVAVISRFASLLDGFSRGLVRDPDFVTILDRDLVDGRHVNPTDKPYFTTAFFHRPEELAAEIDQAGLTLHGVLGVEGPFWFMTGFMDAFEDPALRALMLDKLRSVEAEPSLLGASAHWIAVVERGR